MIPQLQRSDEWLEWRKTKIGASDSAAILGLNPYKSAYRLWEEKMGTKEPDPVNERMKKGIDLEPRAREHFEKMIGMNVYPKVFEHQQYPWMIASLDGFGELKQGNSFAVEIKCNGEKNHEEAVYGRIPKYYECQMQHQMAVTGLQWMYYFSYTVEDYYFDEQNKVVVSGEKGIVLTCPRDDKFIKTLIEKEKEFFHCMENWIMPPSKYKIINDPQGIDLTIQLEEILDRIELLEEQKQHIKQELIKRYNGENCTANGIKLCKEMRKGSIDYAEIPQLSRVNLEKYRKKPIECWKIIRERKNKER